MTVFIHTCTLSYSVKLQLDGEWLISQYDIDLFEGLEDLPRKRLPDNAIHRSKSVAPITGWLGRILAQNYRFCHYGLTIKMRLPSLVSKAKAWYNAFKSL